MRIGVLGAGISGLSFAKLASAKHEVEVLEKNSVPGGIARTREVEGIAYHVTGGHCFNSKNKEVLEFVFNKVLAKEEWHNVQRNASIQFKGHQISYPIEFAVKQIYAFDPELAIGITRDFLNANSTIQSANLEQWFRNQFGDTLAEEYLIPYNTKIWNCEPKNMSPDWVIGKLPMPNKQSFFEGLIGKGEDKMPHSTFYYPNSNNQNTFIEALAKSLFITYNYEINNLHFNKNSGKWVINNEKEYDIMVSTLPLNIIPFLIQETPTNILEHAHKLKFTKVSTMLWETKGTDKTWTYVPDSDSLFHRYIHIGNFFRPAKNYYSITEAVGEKSYEEMVENGKKDNFLIRPVSYHVSKHAYVVFDQNYNCSTSAIKDYLSQAGIYTLGRFGEWQYYNMDICIEKSLELYSALENRFANEC